MNPGLAAVALGVHAQAAQVVFEVVHRVGVRSLHGRQPLAVQIDILPITGAVDRIPQSRANRLSGSAIWILCGSLAVGRED